MNSAGTGIFPVLGNEKRGMEKGIDLGGAGGRVRQAIILKGFPPTIEHSTTSGESGRIGI